jgi:hypothetical protein
MVLILEFARTPTSGGASGSEGLIAVSSLAPKFQVDVPEVMAVNIMRDKAVRLMRGCVDMGALSPVESSFEPRKHVADIMVASRGASIRRPAHPAPSDFGASASGEANARHGAYSR